MGNRDACVTDRENVTLLWFTHPASTHFTLLRLGRSAKASERAQHQLQRFRSLVVRVLFSLLDAFQDELFLAEPALARVTRNR